MSKVINIHEAKTHLSRIIDEVAAGAEVIIAKAGEPMARLSPIARRDRAGGV
jgi:prevent-host-death family protein